MSYQLTLRLKAVQHLTAEPHRSSRKARNVVRTFCLATYCLRLSILRKSLQLGLPLRASKRKMQQMTANAKQLGRMGNTDWCDCGHCSTITNVEPLRQLVLPRYRGYVSKSANSAERRQACRMLFTVGGLCESLFVRSSSKNSSWYR